MKQNKKSWDYQRGKYKQINLKFNMAHYYDCKIISYLEQKENVSSFIKTLILDRMEVDSNEAI